MSFAHREVCQSTPKSVNRSPCLLPQWLSRLFLLCCISRVFCLFKGDNPAITLLPSFPTAESPEFKAPGSSLTGYTNSWNLACLVFKVRCYENLFSPCGLLDAFPSLKPQHLPSCTQLLTTVFTLPKLFSMASCLHLVVEFVLPVFGLLTGLVTQM